MDQTKLEQFYAIRSGHRQGKSIRELAREHHVHRTKVRQAIELQEPVERKTPVRQAPKLGPFKPVIDEWLRADLKAPVKQRHTATRIWQRLCDEHGATDLSYSSVKAYVRKRKPEIWAEKHQSAADAMILQEYLPGQDGQVDFGEAQVIIGGVQVKAHIFNLRLSCSGASIHRGYPTNAQEAFMQGHVDAFTTQGGLPALIRYDNLTPAVVAVLKGRSRQENLRWESFRSYYGINPFYCVPGVDGAHEKGGVEGEVGRFRRQYLVPIPEFDSWEEFNEYLAICDEKDNARRIGHRTSTVGEDFAVEQPHLLPLPNQPYDPAISLTVKVDKSSLISVRNVKYSVPTRLIGFKVRVLLGAYDLRVYYEAQLVATHQRATTKGGMQITLDHYLEVLYHKPGALPGSIMLSQAKADGVFTDEHDQFWQLARKTMDDADATRALIDVLMLHRHMKTENVLAGIRAALKLGSASADVVAVEARAWAELDKATTPTRGVTGEIISLDSRRLTDPVQVIAGLPAKDRPTPNLNKWDCLLTLPKPTLEIPTDSKESDAA